MTTADGDGVLGVEDAWGMSGATVWCIQPHTVSHLHTVPSDARILQVRVKPNARVSQLLLQEDGTWVAQLKSPPVDGKANAELLALVAQQFGVAKSSVTLKVGAGSRLKLVRIEGLKD